MASKANMKTDQPSGKASKIQSRLAQTPNGDGSIARSGGLRGSSGVPITKTGEPPESVRDMEGQVTRSSSDDESSSSYEPVWPTWICRSELTLEQAVALSCNIEPEALRAPEHWGLGDGDEEVARLNLYNSRLEIAQGEAAAGGAFKVRRGRGKDGKKTWFVRMVEFARWAIDLSKMPTVWRELPAAFEPFASGKPAPRWPWGDRTTELLDHMAAAAAEKWKDYDPAFPATAPTSDDVEKFLTKRKWGKKPFPKRVAQVMAQILRADDLKAGAHNNS
jgi:hypothetical protein